jgi:hypothetical protein
MGALIYRLIFAMSLSNLTATGEGGINLKLPHCIAVKASGSLGLNANNLTAYDSVSGDLADRFDLTAGTFTPARNGIYLISGRVSANAGVPSANNFIFSVRDSVGGTVASLPMQGYVGGAITPAVSALITLSASDNYKLSFFQTLANPLAITNTIFTIMLVAEL